MAEPQVTIVIVPRERFSVATQSLTTLLEETDQPFEMVYVDGNSPPDVRDRVSAEVDRRGFELIRTERYLSPNQARNLGLQRVRTPYVLFIDNDVMVTPGWLRELVRCAEETGAWVVGPLIYEGELEDAEVHNAGGFLRFEDDGDGRMLVQDNRYGHRHRSRMPPELERMKVDYVEFHCVLVRRSAFDVLGPLDEQLLSTREHLDLCLQVRAAGGEVWSALTSWVTYDHPPPVTRTDLPFFVLRWSEAWNRVSLRHFAAKYELSEGYLERIERSRARRHVIFQPLREATRRRLGRRSERFVASGLVRAERVVNQVLVGPRARSLAKRQPARSAQADCGDPRDAARERSM
jgi:GT2 family glycosyltransferase